ncbi:hypothetical protein ACIQUD_00425 [Streptomyces globisporus]|uniref:hypothetical protein n=1 Tax=Streptomyces globisporus TaxID=1908 RepID=UPI0037FF3679
MPGDLWLLYAVIGLGLATGALIAVAWVADRHITHRARKIPMPDVLPVLLLAVLLVVALRCLTTALHAGRRGTAPAVEPYRDPRKGFACHRTSCGHMSLPHDDTPEGWRCSGCGHLNPDAG